jgi:hypothetical protein
MSVSTEEEARVLVASIFPQGEYTVGGLQRFSEVLVLCEPEKKASLILAYNDLTQPKFTEEEKAARLKILRERETRWHK